MGFVTDPWAWWVQPFVDNPFMRTAWYAGLLAAVCTAVVGTWVVLRGLTFLGDALAHGVLPGIAIAFILGGDTTVGAFLAALAMVGGISVVRHHSPLPDDTSIGVLFVGFLALAVVIMSSDRAANTGDLNRFLFGSVTGVEDADLWRQGVAAALAVAGAIVFHRAFLVLTFDETLARVLGLRPRLAHGVLLVLVAVAIVASFETVGNLLVFAFLVAPPATATLLVRRVPLVMITAVALGALAATIGVLVSYHHSTATGATMALASVAIFFATLVLTSVGRALAPRVRGRTARTAPA
ncbi:MAG: metal ABC transporter permease [Acidimicrobiales bacterium]|nr:metal ABC transporter permease [Acidimicrobiales bacterium]